jgi:hypothetical protein
VRCNAYMQRLVQRRMRTSASTSSCIVWMSIMLGGQFLVHHPCVGAASVEAGGAAATAAARLQAVVELVLVAYMRQL